MSQEITQLQQVRSNVVAMRPEFAKALPKHIPSERFERCVLTAVGTNPKLVQADRSSLYAACTRAAQIGLLPDGREAALVTFRTRNGEVVQFMPMTAGLMKLVRNSGELSSLDAQVVYKNDKFTYRPGIDSVPQFEPDWFGDRGEAVGAYAVAKTKGGDAYVEIMSRRQVEQVRAVSRAKDDGPWVQWWDEMARKTVFRRLAKRLPMSSDREFDEALRADDETHDLEASAEPMKDVTPTGTRPTRLAAVAARAPQAQPTAAPEPAPEASAADDELPADHPAAMSGALVDDDDLI